MGERMTPADLDAADALANATTPGPWRVDESGWGVNEINGMCVVADLGAWLEPGGANIKVATFIAAARSLVPRLVAEVRARDTVIEAVRELHHRGFEYPVRNDQCAECFTAYPCATTRALGGATDVSR